MKYKEYKDIKLSRLGLGNMRLPSVNPSDPESKIDYPKAFDIIHEAYEKGITYFDTAYVYNGGDSEKCVGEAMKDLPRDSFYLATKFHNLANPDYKAVFQTQLERLQTDHIDFYLLHCLMDNNAQDYLENGAIEYFLDLKEQGKISYLGFSTHASLETTKMFADHHKWDFAQLQFNYYDYMYGHAKEEYEIFKERGIPVMVMEPVRGGRLASLTPEAETLLKNVHPDWSMAEWALRFVKSFDNVQVILSGMSNLEQLRDNMETFDDTEGLNDSEMEVLKEACKIFKSQIQVPCTACRYCTSTCPVQINIPEYLKLYNTYKVDGPWGLKEADKIESVGKPSDCVGCGACTGHCPQNIDTPTLMQELAEVLKK